MAFAIGALAYRTRISPIADYVLAGVLIGPITPGFVTDDELAAQLAKIGVILLMFGVGLHFPLQDLLSVSKIALPGAVVQIAVGRLIVEDLVMLLALLLLPSIFAMQKGRSGIGPRYPPISWSKCIP